MASWASVIIYFSIMGFWILVVMTSRSWMYFRSVYAHSLRMLQRYFDCLALFLQVEMVLRILKERIKGILMGILVEHKTDGGLLMESLLRDLITLNILRRL